MRLALLTLAGALVLAGCDSGDVPSPAERQQGEAPGGGVAADAVELRGQGLAAGSEAFYFAAGQKEVEAALAKALGAALRSGSNPECGAGPVTFTDFPGGLTAHFQEGRLVGWNWHLAQDGDRPASGVVKLAGRVQLGSRRPDVVAAPGYAPVEGSTLGEEFALGEAIGGFIAA
ncbi:MAG: aspartate-semialdehyde dehydrogenase, partial [Erythrobacter cryptus]